MQTDTLVVRRISRGAVSVGQAARTSLKRPANASEVCSWTCRITTFCNMSDIGNRIYYQIQSMFTPQPMFNPCSQSWGWNECDVSKAESYTLQRQQAFWHGCRTVQSVQIDVHRSYTSDVCFRKRVFTTFSSVTFMLPHFCRSFARCVPNPALHSAMFPHNGSILW